MICHYAKQISATVYQWCGQITLRDKTEKLSGKDLTLTLFG